VQSRVERHVRQSADEQRVAVGRRRRDGLRADERAAARAVLDDERLAELRRQALGDEAPDHVVAAAGRARHDDVHCAARVFLRAGDRREEDERAGEPTCHAN